MLREAIDLLKQARELACNEFTRDPESIPPQVASAVFAINSAILKIQAAECAEGW